MTNQLHIKNQDHDAYDGWEEMQQAAYEQQQRDWADQSIDPEQQAAHLEAEAACNQDWID